MDQTRTVKSEKEIRQRVENINVDALNAEFETLAPLERLDRLFKHFKESEVLFTSSFGTKSVMLLHMMSQARPSKKVHFIDTTYHFPETIAYKEELREKLGLKIIDVCPNNIQNQLTLEQQWWKEHPKMCCTINKVAPLEPIVAKHVIWISGLMRYQTQFRSTLRIFERQGDIIKFHPLIDLDEGNFLYLMEKHKLPRHPLQDMGYDSIGCSHCTAVGKGREGRWTGKEKTECGLHPNYFVRKEDKK